MYDRRATAKLFVAEQGYLCVQSDIGFGLAFLSGFGCVVSDSVGSKTLGRPGQAPTGSSLRHASFMK